MARTTESNVQGILGNDYDPDIVLTPFIDTANVVVSRVSTCATRKGITLSTTELEILERWLAAHFYVMSDQTYQQKKTASAFATYQGQTKMNLEASKYGQTAMTIDPSGCMAAIGKAAFAGATWLGLPPSEQTDYVDRN